MYLIRNSTKDVLPLTNFTLSRDYIQRFVHTLLHFLSSGRSLVDLSYAKSGSFNVNGALLQLFI